jgi:glycosidase
MRLILDGVFNHVGRDFWAFRDLLEHGQASPYVDWFVNVDFSQRSPMGDAFDYTTWEGNSSLPKLNVHHPDVRKHLLDAVLWWMDEFSIDGLRLDAADCVEPSFWKDLHHVTKSANPAFWLMGEVIHGDYRQWANAEMFDSVTNYTAYKGLWSSLNDANYHEIAYTLRQQSDHQQGILRHLSLYNFVDNHDVSRVASLIKDPSLLYPVYLLLFMMPGIPSIYYGSEFGIHGRKEDGDAALRKPEDISHLMSGDLSLRQAIQRFSAIRQESRAVQQGDFRILDVQMEQFVFQRSYADEVVIVVINAAQEPVLVEVPVEGVYRDIATDVLNGGQPIDVENGYFHGMVPARWGRVLKIKTRA